MLQKRRRIVIRKLYNALPCTEWSLWPKIISVFPNPVNKHLMVAYQRKILIAFWSTIVFRQQTIQMLIHSFNNMRILRFSKMADHERDEFIERRLRDRGLRRLHANVLYILHLVHHLRRRLPSAARLLLRGSGCCSCSA